jgi:hypothetical protein
VEELLLKRGDMVVEVDKLADIREATPLACAAFGGHVEV